MGVNTLKMSHVESYDNEETENRKTGNPMCHGYRMMAQEPSALNE